MDGTVTQIDASGIVLERKTPKWSTLGFTADKEVRRFDSHMVDTRRFKGSGASPKSPSRIRMNLERVPTPTFSLAS
jgi:hypothetical protein